MSEIYANGTQEERTISLAVPIAPANVQQIDVDIKQNGQTVYTFANVTQVDGGYSVIIPLAYTLSGSDLEIHWAIDYTEDGVPYVYNATTNVEVVTPILTTPEIKVIHPHATPAEVIAIEKIVRHIINAHTGQRFRRFVGTKKIAGNDSNALFLPERLLSIETVNGQDASKHFHIDADGYVLRHYPWGVPPVKADYFGLHMHTGGVIHNPNGVKLGDWYRSKTYEINGVWGWDEVPSQVREAAKLLVNDYACADNAYRDRYLTSMTAADWRIQFHAGAFANTGNVRADQLLSDFVLKRGWAVI